MMLYRKADEILGMPRVKSAIPFLGSFYFSIGITVCLVTGSLKLMEKDEPAKSLEPSALLAVILAFKSFPGR